MGILDGYSFDPTSPDGGASPGWLGLVLGAPLGAGPPQGWSDQASTNAALSGGGKSPQVPASGVGPSASAGDPLGALGMTGFPTPAPAIAPTAPPSPGVGDRFGAALMNFANARGLLPAIAGGITGLSTGVRTDPAALVQQQALSTYQALVAAGINPGIAQAVALNPRLMRGVAPRVFAASMPRRP
jgi:hypothetical protein